MLRAGCALLLLAAQAAAPVSHEIPAALRGEWVITRLIPTRTISCWGDREARGLIGTRIIYSPDSFAWKGHVIDHAKLTTRRWTAQSFFHEYCGGPADSCVDFGQLGVHANTAVVLTIQHPHANITGATAEIPGDWVLFKDKTTIVISVCNLYFEAHRR